MRVLSRGLEWVGEACGRRYRYRPWLVESFLDRSRFSGTRFRAANWMLVGETKGRGRQDRFSKREETIKDIYVYPLEKDFRTRLGLAAGAGLGPLGPGDGLEGGTWAQQGLGGAPLGGARLTTRLLGMSPAQGEKTGPGLTGGGGGDWPGGKGV